MQIIGEYIKKLREEKKLSQRELARLSDINNAEISRIESGNRKNVAPSVLKSIAPHLGVPYWELMSKAGYLDETSIQAPIEDLKRELKVINDKIMEFGMKKLSLSNQVYKNYIDEDHGKEELNKINNAIKELSFRREQIISEKMFLTSKKLETIPAFLQKAPNIDFIPIPIVRSIRASMPAFAEENYEGYFPTDKQFISNDREYFYLKIKGDSMDKEFKEGSLVLVQKQKTIEPGEIGVVLVNGFEATVKKIFIKDNFITLMPQSANVEHLPQTYDLSKEEIKILGKVVLAVKKY